MEKQIVNNTNIDNPEVIAAQLAWFDTKWRMNYLLAIGCSWEEINKYLDEYQKNGDHEKAMLAIGKDPNTKASW